MSRRRTAVVISGPAPVVTTPPVGPFPGGHHDFLAESSVVTYNPASGS